jgi:glucokinase
MRSKIIGIDLGGTNLKIALLDLRYKILSQQVLVTKNFRKKEALILGIIGSVNKIIKDNRLEKTDILGVGLGLPGPIEAKKGIVYSLTNIPGWKNVNLRAILKNKLRLPIFIDNDAHAMAIAESRLGAAKGAKNAVCLTLGTGVGGAIIIDRHLYYGSTNSAGEIGHIPINEKGPGCNCGGQACLETYIGNKVIMRNTKKLFGRDISLIELSRLAKNRSKRAISIWKDIGEKLGIALTGVVNFLNPDCIVIGGGVSGAGKILFMR